MIVHNCSNKHYQEAAAVSLSESEDIRRAPLHIHIAMFLTDTKHTRIPYVCSHFISHCAVSCFVFIFIENTLFVQTQKMYSKLFHVYRQKYIKRNTTLTFFTQKQGGRLKWGCIFVYVFVYIAICQHCVPTSRSHADMDAANLI